jgi:zinc transporter 2
MEGSPIEVDLEILKSDLMKIRGVTECHDIHVWCLSVGKISMSCHLVSNNPQESLKEASDICRNKYKIKHSTIQVESTNNQINHDCDHDLH